MSRLVEEWRPVVGYEGLYEVSDWGRVKSLGSERYHVIRILKGYVGSIGYRVVNLYKDGKPIKKFIHRLVVEAFIPNPENKPCVDHINTIRDDNRVENLRWANYIENNNNPITKKRMSEAQKTVAKIRDNYGRFLKNENRTD